MYNCIFTPHCTEAFCDKSCPILAETSYLLERNGITPDSFVFSDKSIDIQQMLNVLNKSADTVGTLVVNDSQSTVQYADMLTYCAICQNWQGSQLHCSVYNLKYSKYLDALKQSWSLKSEPEELEYMRIWSESAKVLIVSGFDYVKFGDFESQVILNLLQSRQSTHKTTIFVSPPLRNLVSAGKADNISFFGRFKSILVSGIEVVKK